GFADGLRPFARDADGDADLTPDRIGHTEHGDLTHAGMRENLLLDLPRIDVGAAGDVHVGGAAGDVDEAFFVDMAEIAGAEPAVAKRLRIGVGIVVIAGEHCRPDHADLAGLERLQLAASVVLDRDLHAQPLEPASADPRARAVLLLMQRAGIDRDVAGDFAEAKILHD